MNRHLDILCTGAVRLMLVCGVLVLVIFALYGAHLMFDEQRKMAGILCMQPAILFLMYALGSI